jgi:hypothetical protein
MSQLDPIIAILERDGQIDNFQAIEKRLSLRLWRSDSRSRGQGIRLRNAVPTRIVQLFFRLEIELPVPAFRLTGLLPKLIGAANDFYSGRLCH